MQDSPEDLEDMTGTKKLIISKHRLLNIHKAQQNGTIEEESFEEPDKVDDITTDSTAMSKLQWMWRWNQLALTSKEFLGSDCHLSELLSSIFSIPR